ncbi:MULTISPECIES: transcriptional regulator [Serratia]|uniref:Helix-turn-helix domain-containing protein n=1 Tax=Serratia ureilytica TaxID=300181 RepID=A0A9X9BZ50_9GAMM|nr:MULTISPECIES: YdaS family helix-turn-helix protein [Serratia]TXE22817.1 helix-turn-helix domain-containing protein [Serratia ureilytica]HEJ7828031.1 helix-turn-helix domain-containing protein [Serratia marcescens]
MTVLDEVIKNFRSASGLAKALEVTPMTVSQWRHRDKGKVPERHLMKIYELTGITPHELRPDIHPNPTSGLPLNINNNIADD